MMYFSTWTVCLLEAKLTLCALATLHVHVSSLYRTAVNFLLGKIFTLLTPCSHERNSYPVNISPVLMIILSLWRPSPHGRKFIPLSISAM